MNESGFWSQRIRKLVAPYGFAQRVENGLDAGTPDVYYCIDDGQRCGWIENKYREDPPRRLSTVVFGSAHGLRTQQIAWWRLYLAAGGRGVICAGIGSDTYGLLASIDVLNCFNTMTLEQFRAHKITELRTML